MDKSRIRRYKTQIMYLLESKKIIFKVGNLKCMDRQEIII